MLNNKEGIMGNPQAVRQSNGNVSYWKVCEVTAATMASIPDWVQGKLRNGEIKLTYTLDVNTFTNKVTASYVTIVGNRTCHDGDYIILDRQDMYHVTEADFNRMFVKTGES